MPPEELGASYLAALRRGFQLARERHGGCRPVHILAGISEGSGPAAATLAASPGRSLREVLTAARDIPGDSAAYLHMQAQDAAQLLARGLGQRPEAEHLLVALLDQGTAEVMRTLSRAGLDPAAVRRAALTAIGAPAELPPVTLPPLMPAGTADRPALPAGELDARAWRALRWRQDHLPVGRLRRPPDRQALSRLEQDAAWRLAGQLGLDDDQRYSLVWHHSRRIEQRAAEARPDLDRAGPRHMPARLHRRHAFLNVTVGWGVWLRNRQANLRYRWFRLRTLRHYRGAPAL